MNKNKAESKTMAAPYIMLNVLGSVTVSKAPAIINPNDFVNFPRDKSMADIRDLLFWGVARMR